MNSKFSNSATVIRSARSSPSPFTFSFTGLQCNAPSFTSQVLFFRFLKIFHPFKVFPSNSGFHPESWAKPVKLQASTNKRIKRFFIGVRLKELENFSRIQDSIRIKYFFNAAHQVQVHFAH